MDKEEDYESKTTANSEKKPGISITERIRGLAEKQPFAVLCTQADNQPYGSLIGFATSEDLKYIVFATPMATRKYKLISECRNVSVVVDNRVDYPDDFMKVEAFTATGKASQLSEGPEYRNWADLLIARHPYQRAMIEASSCALFCVEVIRYIHVHRFQEVNQWIPA